MTGRQGWKVCGVGALLAGVWASADLVAVWRDSPYDRWGGWAAALWAAAVLRAMVAAGWNPQPIWSLLGMGAMALGLMADISAVVQGGMVLTAAGWPDISIVRRGLLALTGLSWMPALGWLLSGWMSADVCQGVRLALALSAWAAVGRGK